MASTVSGSAAPLDSVLLVVTPENVRFDFRIAGPFSRLVAFFIDYLLIAVIVIATAMVFGFLIGEASTGFILITFFALQWGYAGFLETFCNGQTVGKKALRLRVVSTNGLPINAQQAFLRGFLRTADLVPHGFAGLGSMMFSRRFQRLGDLAAGTIVVIEGKQGRVSSPESVPATTLSANIIPARFRPDPALIEGLTLYMSRRKKLSKPRRREIARNLARHFIRMWSLPEQTNPDELLCLLYARLVARQSEQSVKPSRDEQKSETPNWLTEGIGKETLA